MRDIFKKDLDLETNKTTSTPNAQETSQAPESPQTTEEPEEIDYPQFEEPTNAPDVLDLLASFQKMKTEEQKLLEIKKQILTKQQDLQNKLIKEIEKKKTTIANLTSEIPDLQNTCKQLGQALGAEVCS